MQTNTRATRLLPALVLTLTALAFTARTSACDCGKSARPSAALSATHASSGDTKPAPKKHPLKGVVTDLLPDQSALMVKHEEIPGVMKAMTMMFTVDPAVLSTVKKDDAITGQMHRDAEGTWRLDEIKVVPSKS